MNGKTQLRFTLIICLMALTTILLSAVPPLSADTDAFSLTTQVSPPGSGTVTVNPDPPYSQDQLVSLTATPAAGYVFDNWIQADDTTWWDAAWDYRVEVTAAAAGYARKDKPAEFNLNFTQLWNSLSTTGTLDPNSIRVVEIDANGNVIDETLPFQFDKATDYNAATKAAGTLVLIMEGNTAAGTTRRYHIYFDVTGKGFAPPNVPAQVILTEGLEDEEQLAFKVETPAGTYFLHTLGGGFSSLDDVNGNDWIGYSTVPKAGGAFRGIPNVVLPNNGGFFHPGEKKMVTTLRSQGPIKTTIHVIREKNVAGLTKWEGLYEIYPNYATFTMLKTPGTDVYDYWFLYEGTPGGSLDLTTDFVVRSDGTQTLANQSWSGDLPGDEWVYFSDPNVGAAGRSLYFASHIEDNEVDSYTQNNIGGLMTVFGFGRSGGTALLDYSLIPREFTFGLMDETGYDNAKPIIYNAYRDLNVNVGAAESNAGASLGSQNPLPFTITGEHTIIANFKPAQYTVTTNVSPVGVGTVTKTPPQATYGYNEMVTLAAAPTAQGYFFTGWTGDVDGSTNPITVPVTKNMVVTANFAQSFTVTTSADPLEGGSVALDPPGPSYQPGTQITVTATANSGYMFTGWEGIAGDNPTEMVTVDGNLTITANFTPIQQHTVTVTVPGGGGSVSKDPPQDTYPTGATVTLSAVPDTLKRFVSWGGDASGTDPVIQVTVTGDLTITAAFEDDGYPLNVTLSPPEGGTVGRDPNQTNYLAGTDVTLTATANPGWTFAGWSGDAVGASNPIVVTVQTGGTNVVATFDPPPAVTLTTSTAGNGTGTIQREPAGPTYPSGQVVKLTAVPNSGSVFAGWSGDAGGSVNPLMLTMNSDKSVIANFIVPSGPFSDNFNSCGLDAHWSEIDPLGGGDFENTGTQLRIIVPEGISHNVWSDGNNAPRIMQPADNAGFEYVVKFDSPLTQSAQMQGIIVEQDDANFIRFDFEYNEGLKVYAAIIDDGVAKRRVSDPIINAADATYLRVTRVGSKWTMSYSGNGVDWVETKPFTFELNVAEAGVFAGNVAIKGAPAPAHTAVVDYFHNLAEGPMPEDTPLLDITTVGGGTVNTNPPLDQLSCGQTVTLTAAPGAGWTFGSWSGDASGTQNSVSVLLDEPRAVTATFIGSGTQYIMLPMVIR